MFLSTIIPVYNAEKYLERCLDSVLAQNVPDCEIICVDDGSEDASPAILEEYQKAHSDLRVMHQANSHAGVARNNGLARAKGKYIHFLDADDYLVLGIYKDLKELLEDGRLADVDYLKFRSYTFDMETNERIKEAAVWDMKDVDIRLFGKKTNFAEHPDLFLNHSHAPWGGIYRKEFLTRNHIQFGNLIAADDRSFYAEVLYRAEKIFLYDGYGVCYQQNNKDSLVGIRNDHFGDHITSYKLIRDALRDADPGIRSQILAGELMDLVFWYGRCNTFQKQGSREQVRLFLESLCVEELDSRVLRNRCFLDALDDVSIDPLQEVEIIDSRPQWKDILDGKETVCIAASDGIACAVAQKALGQKVSTVFDKEKKTIIAAKRTDWLFLYYDLKRKGCMDIAVLSEAFYQDICVECLWADQDKWGDIIKKNRHIAIYGKGLYGGVAYRLLQKAGVEPCYVVDRYDRDLFYGLQELGFEEIPDKKEVDLWLITPAAHAEAVIAELGQMGIHNTISLADFLS